METDVLKNLREIKQSAEIALEHHASRAFKNNPVTVALENIIAKATEGIENIGKENTHGKENA